MSIINITVSYPMSDGRLLECKYTEIVTPGFTSGLPENCYPEEVEVSDPEYYIDDIPVNYSELPKGLDAIADAMFEADDGDDRFFFKSVRDEPAGDYGFYFE